MFYYTLIDNFDSKQKSFNRSSVHHAKFRNKEVKYLEVRIDPHIAKKREINFSGWIGVEGICECGLEGFESLSL